MSLAGDVKKRDGYQCQKCGRSTDSPKLEAHHIVPKHAGGPDELGNLVTLCAHCHRYAPDRLPEHSSYPRVFADYVRTGVRPEFDMMHFGIMFSQQHEKELDVDQMRHLIRTLYSVMRDMEDGHSLNHPPQIWVILASQAGYGTVGEEIRGEGYQVSLLAFALESATGD